VKRALSLGLATSFLVFAGVRCEQAATTDTPYREVGAAEQSVIVATRATTSASPGAKVAVGGSNVCAVLGNNSALKCWGSGSRLFADGQSRGDQIGEMGDKLPLVDLTPYEVPRINEVAIGKWWYSTACVTRADVGGNYVTQCWGENGRGQLGLGDTITRNTPVKILPAGVPPLFGYRVAVGGEFVCRMPGNDMDGPTGAVFCLGDNVSGQLGYGDTIQRGDQVSELGAAERPVDLGTGRRAKRIVAGSYHACALLDNDQVKCWGRNGSGQLGVGDYDNRGDSPGELGDALPAVNLGSGRHAIEISAGCEFTCAILDNGITKCWGSGQFLGSGKDSSFGNNRNAAALGDNPLWTGVKVSGARNLTSGCQYTCVTDSTGTQVTCWGSAAELGLGFADTYNWVIGDEPSEFDATDTTRLRNTGMTDLGTLYSDPAKVESLAAGSNSTCAVISGGATYNRLKCWGGNGFGQLGLGDTANRGDPDYYYDEMIEDSVPIQSHEMGNNLPVVNTGSRSVAWLEDATKPFQNSPIASGDHHSCAILSRYPSQTSGPVKCWGKNTYGQLGLGDTNHRGDVGGEMDDALPFVDLGPGRVAKWLAVGSHHTCAILDDDTVKCWGLNSDGQLGYGDRLTRGDQANEMGTQLPVVSLGTGLRPVRLAAGTAFTCALLDNNQLKCWGNNDWGQIGRVGVTRVGGAQGEMGDALAPIDLGTTDTIVNVKAGGQHVCATIQTANGYRVKCWGYNYYGQLGLGDTNNRGDAVEEMGTGLPFLPIGGDLLALGARHTCVGQSGANGTFRCWGLNSYGQLGYGDTLNRWDASTAEDIATDDLGMSVQKLWAGGYLTCALGVDSGTDGSFGRQRVKCWGYGAALGTGDSNNRGDGDGEMGPNLPYVDVGLSRAAGITSIAIGPNTSVHSICAVVQATGQIKCWGGNEYGDLGLGDTLPRGASPGQMGNALPFVNLGSDPNETTDHCPGMDDGKPCTADACNPATNTVTHTNVANNTPCNDNSICTTGDACSAGNCVGTAVAINDLNPCTMDTCDATSGVKHVPAQAGTLCNDNNACTVNDACTVAGTCSGAQVVLPPATQCAYSVCNASGGITTVNAQVGTACNADDNVCTTDTCNGSGVCVAGGLPFVSDDGLVCTSESCDPVTGYPVHTPIAKGTACGGSGATTECDGAGRCAAALGYVLALPAATALGVVGEGSVGERATALYTGTDAIQKPLNGSTAPFVFDQKRVSLVQGRVLGTDSLPLAKVQVTIKDHPEYGYTESRVDGKYDLVVEGGGQLSVNFGRANYFPAQRSVRVDWDKAFLVEDVVLVKPDLATEPQTVVPLCTSGCNVSDAMTIHVASATQTSAQAGKRGAVMLFPASAQAQVSSSTQTTAPLPSLNVAATEYTRDVPTDESTALAEHFRDPRSKSSGTLAMPGELPSASGYTFAVDLFDTAQMSDPTADVKFTGAALPILYVDNFIGFPVGATVPAGSYDKTKAAWKPEASGQVVRIASVNSSNQSVTLDYGTGTAPADMTAEELNAIYLLTTATYSSRFKVNDTLWRVKIAHFSPWDCNWPYGPQECSEGGPCADDDPGAANSHDATEDKPNCKPGSTILCESRVLGENIPVAGTGWDLVYTSERVPAYKAPLEVEVTPPGGTRVKNRWMSAYTQAGSSYLVHAFNGTVHVPTPKDNLGRVVNGTVQAKTELVEHYSVVYNPGYVFGLPANGPRYAVASDRARAEMTVTHRYEFQVLNFDARSAGLGGWDLSIHHWLDRVGGWIFRGDGTRQKALLKQHMMERSILGVQGGTTTTGTPADGSNWNTLQFDGDMIFAPNGDLFLTSTFQRLYQVSWDKTRVPCTDLNDAGPCVRWVAFSGDSSVPLVPADGTPALAKSARTAGSTGQIALASDGSLYILRGWGVFRLYQTTAGSSNPWYVEKVAGTSQQPPESYVYNTPIEGIGGPAKLSSYVGLPRGIAVAADGTVYMLTYGTHPSLTAANHVLLKIDTDGTRRADGRLDNDGTLRMVIGGGSSAFSNAALPKNAYELYNLPGGSAYDNRLAMAPNGDLYFGQSDLYVVRKNGRVERVTNPNSPTYVPPKEGVLASTVGTLNQGLADKKVDAVGNVFFGDVQLYGVRRIDPSGVIATVSGIVSGAVGEVAAPVVGASAVPARLTRLPSITPSRIAVAPNGDIYVATSGSNNGSPIFRVFLPKLMNLTTTVSCPVAVPSTDGQEVYCFDESGRHLDTRDARTCVNRSVTECAKKFSFTYESLTSGNVSAITDAAGNVTTITRTSGQVQIAPPVGSPTTLLTDAESSYLNRVIDPAGGTWAVTMSSDGLLKSIEDPRGTYRHDFTYDQRGKLNTDGLFNKAASQTEGEQALQSAPGADNQVVKDTNGVPISPTTYATTVKHTSAAGLQTTYDVRRDASGKVARKVTLPTDLIKTTTENPDGSTTTVEPDLVQSVQVLASDPLFGMNAPLSTVTTTFPSGRRVDSQRLHVHGTTDSVSLAYGPTGGAMRTTTRTWDPSGRTLETQSPGGRKSTVVLDTLGRVASMREPGFQASSFSYFNSPVGNGVLRSSTARGAVTIFDYFADGRAKGYLERVTSPVATLAYNDRDALGLPLNLSVSGSGLASSLVTSFGWDQVGNMTSLTPPGQPAHGQTYAGFNQLASYTAPAMSTVASNSTVLTYDNDRGLSTITRPGRAPISYVKDQGRLDYFVVGGLQAGNPAVDVDYYAANETTNGASPGHIKSVTGLGPIANVSPVTVATTSPKLTYTYEGYLPLSEAYSGPVAGMVSRTFDNYLNVATQTVAVGAATSTVSYTTDADGSVATTSISGVANGLSTSYDAASNYRLSSATVGTTVSGYTYDDYGTLASLGYASGTTTLFQAQYHTPRGGTADPAVARDAVGRLWKLRENRSDGQHTYVYTYDAAGRLTTVTQDNVAVENYSYDGNGNRTDLIAGTAGTAYDAQDRMLSYAQSVNGVTKFWACIYKDDGALSTLTDVATGAATRYTYDELGNLIKVVLSDGTAIDYIIDGRGRRIGKKRNGTLVKAWLYDGQLRIAAELDVASNVVSRFVYGTRSNIPDYMVKYTGATVSGVYRIVADHLGSPRMVVDVTNSATKLLEARYSTFGIPSLVNNTGSLAAIPFGFAGGLYDVDTGLVRFGARDYDARFGRWTNKDPILFDGGQTNLYVYVGNDPVNSRDETGLAGPPGAIIGGIIGAVASGVGAYLTGADAGQIAIAAVIGGGIGALGGLFEPGAGTSAGIGAASGVVGAMATGGGYGSMALSGLVGALSGAVGALAPGASGVIVGALTGFAGGLAAAGPGAEIDKRLKRGTPQPCPSSR